MSFKSPSSLGDIRQVRKDSDPTVRNQAAFSLTGALAGAKQAVPLAVSVFAYGSVFGVLALQADLTAWQAVCMSAFVYAGSAQFIVLELWETSLPVLPIILTTFVVNLRHVLMGAALQPWLTGVRARRKYVSAFFMAAENWALTIREFKAGQPDAAFLLGSGLVVYLAWLSATTSGFLVGATLEDPERFGLDFAFLAVFLALLGGIWRGKSDLLPWTVAAAVAVLAAKWLPGKWYILLGGVGGSLVGVLTDES